jgi:hypothetical protein
MSVGAHVAVNGSCVAIKKVPIPSENKGLS